MKTVTVWLMDDDSLDAKPVVYTDAEMGHNSTFFEVYSKRKVIGHRIIDVKKYEVVVVDE